MEGVTDIFLSDFQSLAPPSSNIGKLMLADLAIRGIFNYEYLVVDEEAVAGAIY